MKLNAMPNLNGNDEKDFQEVYFALREAQEAIDKAGQKLSFVLHGRNYQHLWGGRDDDAIIADRRNCQGRIADAKADLGEIMSAIVDVLEKY